jgi:hypothetical protein
VVTKSAILVCGDKTFGFNALELTGASRQTIASAMEVLYDRSRSNSSNRTRQTSKINWQKSSFGGS